MQLISSNSVPATYGAWDRMFQNAREQNELNRSAEADRAARIELNVADLDRILAKGDLRAPVFWAKRKNPVRAEQVGSLLWEAAECDARIQSQLMTLLFHASEGSPLVTEYAQELRRAVIQKAAELEAE